MEVPGRKNNRKVRACGTCSQGHPAPAASAPSHSDTTHAHKTVLSRTAAIISHRKLVEMFGRWVFNTFIDHSVKNASTKLHFRAFALVQPLGDKLRGMLRGRLFCGPQWGPSRPSVWLLLHGLKWKLNIKIWANRGEDYLNEKCVDYFKQ